MRTTKKLSELTDLTPVENLQELKGGFFFLLSHLLHKAVYKGYGHKAHEYQAPSNHYNSDDRKGKNRH